MITPTPHSVMMNAVICDMPLNDLIPARVNDRIYRPVEESDPSIRELTEDVRKNGLLEPIIVTLDHVILSGHRRRAACLAAGLSVVPTRTYPISSNDSDFLQLLVSCNSQRVKTRDETLREAVSRIDPEVHTQETSHDRFLIKSSDSLRSRSRPVMTIAGVSVAS